MLLIELFEYALVKFRSIFFLQNIFSMTSSKLQILRDLPADFEVSALFWSEAGLFYGDMNGSIYLYEADYTPQGGNSHIGQKRLLTSQKLAITSICCIKDFCVSSSLDSTIMVFNYKTNNSQIITSIPSPYVLIPIDSIDSVAIGSLDGSVYFINSKNSQTSGPFKLFNEPICSIARNPIENQIVALSSKEFVLFDFTQKTEINRLKITADCCTSCSISDNGLSCVISTTEGTVRIVDMISFKEAGCVLIDQVELNKVIQTDYGKRFVVLGCNGKVNIFNINTMMKESGIIVGKLPLIALSIQPVDMKIAIAGSKSSITLLNFEK